MSNCSCSHRYSFIPFRCFVLQVLVGEAGLEKVKKASRLPHVFSAVPSLHKLLPFLELTPHQDYLVDRVRQLARGGAMSEYRWSGGGRHRGAEWAHERGLPADAELVMHCVAAYFDARLPPAEGVIDGRVFSTLHLFKEAARGSAAAGSPSPSSTNAPMVPQPGVAAESAKELSARLSSPSVPVADFAIVQVGMPPPFTKIMSHFFHSSHLLIADHRASVPALLPPLGRGSEAAATGGGAREEQPVPHPTSLPLSRQDKGARHPRQDQPRQVRAQRPLGHRIGHLSLPDYFYQKNRVRLGRYVRNVLGSDAIDAFSVNKEFHNVPNVSIILRET